MASTLYICYFGLREPLVQTQVLPYLREIQKDGTGVSILTFEPEFRKKWTPEQIAGQKANLADEGIDWQCLAYHKWPSVPATLYDIFRGTLFIRRFISKQKPDILHGRVHLPTLMGAMARKLSRHKPKLLFDIRGFFPEEYTDAGIWPEGGWLYRGAKRVERWLLKEADGYVVLTEKARGILFGDAGKEGEKWRNGDGAKDAEIPQPAIRNPNLNGPVEVIPCCVDISRFDTGISRQDVRNRLELNDRFVVAYVGSFGGWYMTDEMMDFFEAAREFRPDTFVMILTQRDKEKIAKKLSERGFAARDFLVESVHPTQIPDYLSAADVALSFIKACYSKLSSSPTKIAEYLACGVPIIANQGVGDIDDLIEENGVGAIVDAFTRDRYINALREIGRLTGVSERCKETSKREFHLDAVGGKRYRRIYRRILDGNAA
jgi:glycosyltransferase involved in cell wall biosynthesis